MSTSTNTSMKLPLKVEGAIRRAKVRQAEVVSVDDGDCQVLVVRLSPAPDEEERTELEELCRQLDKPWKRDFIEWLRKGRNVTQAAELSGVTARHAHRTYHKDPVFARAWSCSHWPKRD